MLNIKIPYGKRNSRIDNFLMKCQHVFRSNEEQIQYYENVVFEAKGKFFHAILIITNLYLHITRNPPKRILMSIRLTKISDFKLVPESHSIVTDARKKSQHVLMKYIQEDVCKKTEDFKERLDVEDKKMMIQDCLEQSRSILSSPISSTKSSSNNATNHHRNNLLPINIIQSYLPITRSIQCEEVLETLTISSEEQTPSSILNSTIATEVNEHLGINEIPSSLPSSSEINFNTSNENLINEIHFYLFENNSTFLKEFLQIWNHAKNDWNIDEANENVSRGMEAEEHEIDAFMKSLLKITKKLIRNQNLIFVNYKRSQLLAFVKKFNDYLRSGKISEHQINFDLENSLWNTLKIAEQCIKEETEKMKDDALPEIFLIDILLIEILKKICEKKNITGRRSNSIYLESYLCSLPIKCFNCNEINTLRDPKLFRKYVWTLKEDASLTIQSFQLIRLNILTILSVQCLERRKIKGNEDGKNFLRTLKCSPDFNFLLDALITQILISSWGVNEDGDCYSYSLTLQQSHLCLQQLLLLSCFLQNFNSSKNYIKSNYFEEFKYFSHEKFLGSKIPEEYLMKQNAISLLRNIRKNILND